MFKNMQRGGVSVVRVIEVTLGQGFVELWWNAAKRRQSRAERPGLFTDETASIDSFVFFQDVPALFEARSGF